MVNLIVSLLKGKNSNKLTLLNENLDRDDLIKICNSSRLKDKYKLEKGKDFSRYDEILNCIEKLDIKCITLKDEKYPEKLKEIFDPPFMLFVRGDENVLNSNLVSVVGTRKPSRQGYYSSFKFGMDLGRADINAVSGLALGVDGAVHRGNIATGGKTVAVLGSGIDTIYPKEHKDLAGDILKRGGAIVSEFPPGEVIRRYNFPKRNRIVAGLSSHLVIIQAPKKSGSLITGDFALESGREVWIHSCGIGDKRFLGSDKYYKDGASKLDTAYPLLKEFNQEYRIEDFDSSNYSESSLLDMELKGEIVRYKGGYFLK